MDSQQEIISCFQWASRDLDLRIPTNDDIRNVIGLGMHQAVRTIFPEFDSEESQQPIIERYRHYYFSPDKPPSDLFNGVSEMLHQLNNQGYFLAVATGKGRRGLDQVLERTGLTDVFHYTRCVDEAHSKPHPQMLLDVLDYLGVDNRASLMIGDTEYDLLMAKNAQVESVAVCCGAHDKSRLESFEPLTCIDWPHELQSWLETFERDV